MVEFMLKLDPLAWVMVVLVALGSYLAVTMALQLVLAVSQATQDVLRGPKLGQVREVSHFDRILTAVGERFEGLSGLSPQWVSATEKRLIFAGRPHAGISGAAYLAGYTVIGLFAGAVLGFATFAILLVDGVPATGVFDAAVRGLGVFLITPLIAHLYGWMALVSEARITGDELIIEFPFFLDLAVLVVQAGGLPQDTFKQYVEAAPGTALARELQVTIREAEATSIEIALLRMSERVQSQPIQMILRNLAQAQRTSGNLSSFYAEQAVELRSIRAELTENAIEKLKVNLKIPEFMLMTGIALVAMAPTLIQMGLF